jgi:hypothetical protein
VAQAKGKRGCKREKEVNRREHEKRGYAERMSESGFGWIERIFLR